MAEPPVSSSSSLPPSGDPSLEFSLEASQPTRSVDFWQPRDAWYGFGNEEEFPPLTSKPSLLATTLLATARRLFDNQVASSKMYSLSPVSSEELYVSTNILISLRRNFLMCQFNLPHNQFLSHAVIKLWVRLFMALHHYIKIQYGLIHQLPLGGYLSQYRGNHPRLL